MILIDTARKETKMILDYPQYPNGMYILGKNDFDDIARAVLKEYIVWKFRDEVRKFIEI